MFGARILPYRVRQDPLFRNGVCNYGAEALKPDTVFYLENINNFNGGNYE